MAIAAPSLTQFPGDILCLISQQCDAKTLYAFRSTCKISNTIGKTEMSVETSARVVFYHPERYLDLKQNCLKESRAVVLNALTKLPKLFFDKGLPDHFRHDVAMIKTAFVAARLLKDVRTEERLYDAHADMLGGIVDELALERRIPFMDIKDEIAAGGPVFVYDVSDESELYQLQPFVCFHPLLNYWRTPSVIQKHLDIALEILARRPQCRILDHVDNSLCDNEELVRRAVRGHANQLCSVSARLRDNENIVLEAASSDEYVLSFAGDRLKDSESFIWKALLQSQSGYPLRVASPRIQKNVVFQLLAGYKDFTHDAQYFLWRMTRPCRIC